MKVEPSSEGTNTGPRVGRLATRYQGRFQSDDAFLTARLMGGRNSQVLACDRRLLRGDDFSVVVR